MWEVAENKRSSLLPVSSRALRDLLSDLDVEQCVEEMFQPWLNSASESTVALLKERREVAAPLNPMISTRPAGVVGVPPLPRQLREELLELCTEIMQATKSQNLQMLMICGIASGVGASFVARCLSGLLAEFRQLRVALLPVVSASAAAENRSGQRVSNMLMRRDVDYVLFRTERPNLMEIASPQGAITITELLCGTGTSVALQHLKREFDFIVVDTPAVAMHAEVALLAALMDGVILVAKQHTTSLRQMDQAYHRLGKVEANVLGVVLNRQKRI